MADSSVSGMSESEAGVPVEPKPSSYAALRSVVVFWGSVALIQFAVFCLLRSSKRFRRLYNVRDSVEKLRCALATRDLSATWDAWNVFAWIPAVLRASDDEIFAQVGLDALCYIRTLSMGIKLSAVGCFVALWSIPTYFTSPKVLTEQIGETLIEHPLSNFNVSDVLDKMSMGHAPSGSDRMISGVVAAYVISFYGMWLLHREFNWFIIQRHRYLQRNAPQNFTMYLSRLPPALRSQFALQEYFSVFFNDIYQIHLMKRVPKLEGLCVKRDKLTTQIKHNEALLEIVRGRRPSPFSSLTLKTQKARELEVESIILKDKSALEDINVKLRQRVRELEEEWAAHERGVAAGDAECLASPPATYTDAAFVSFRTLQSATCARQLSYHELPFNVMAEEAPVPNHVIWQNLGVSPLRKEGLQLLAMAATAAICLFWVIPVTFVATLQKAEELKKLGPPGCHAAGTCPLKVVAEHFPLLDEFLAILAPYLLLFLSYTLPVILWYVVALEGHVGMDTFHASLFSKLTLFMIVQTFFVSAMAGALFSELSTFVEQPLTHAQRILANSLPAQAVTFISLIWVKTTYRLMVELLRPWTAVKAWMRTWIGPRLTPEERAQDYLGLRPFIWFVRPLCSPGPLKYHILFPDVVLMFTVLFVYTVLSPIANLFLLPAFTCLNIAFRHQIIFIYDPSNDTGGQLWPQFASYFTIAMLIAQITVLGVLSLNESPAAPFMVPLIAGTVYFRRYLDRQHPRIAQTLPLFSCFAADRRAVKDEDCHAFLHDKYKQRCLILSEAPAHAADLEEGAAGWEGGPRERSSNGEGEGGEVTSGGLVYGGGVAQEGLSPLGLLPLSTSGGSGRELWSREGSGEGSVEAALGVLHAEAPSLASPEGMLEEGGEEEGGEGDAVPGPVDLELAQLEVRGLQGESAQRREEGARGKGEEEVRESRAGGKTRGEGEGAGREAEGGGGGGGEGRGDSPLVEGCNAPAQGPPSGDAQSLPDSSAPLSLSVGVPAVHYSVFRLPSPTVTHVTGSNA